MADQRHENKAVRGNIFSLFFRVKSENRAEKKYSKRELVLNAIFNFVRKVAGRKRVGASYLNAVYYRSNFSKVAIEQIGRAPCREGVQASVIV